MPPVRAAVVAAEDERFWDHGGIDVAAIVRGGQVVSEGTAATVSAALGDAWFVGYTPQLVTAVWSAIPRAWCPCAVWRGSTR